MQVRLIRFTFFFLFFTLTSIINRSNSQVPVSWKFTGKRTSDGIEIMAFAEIEKSWVIYGQTMVEDGPVPTTFSIGGKEIRFDEITKPLISQDEMFELKLEKFSNEAVFKLILKDIEVGSITGEVRYMTCDGKKCLPPSKVQFDLKID